ncbi:MAG: preprotein translocase subunit YajC [Candidatus Omnitrophica bacterium]|nr:preprotein translocase subunit YajC [Candidatus Omnitrophota bacterium]MDD5611260.1 preprotein translocase subunit YajC [Candidatus Omnitrophota bacterium]
MPTSQGANPLVNLLPLILIFVIFYFLLIRPQKQREKEHQKMLNSVAKNDDVITSGGIHGTVVNVKDKTVIIRVDENVRLEVEKAYIIQIVKKQEA